MMLTALGDAQSEITGLISGADDYIAKPFNYEVFLARVHSMTRKAKKSKEMAIDIGNIKVLEDAHKVFVDGQEVFLSRKEYHLLLLFIANPKIVLSREGLSHDDELQGESNSISNQKAMLEDYAEKNSFTGIRHFTEM